MSSSQSKDPSEKTPSAPVSPNSNNSNNKKKLKLKQNSDNNVLMSTSQLRIWGVRLLFGVPLVLLLGTSLYVSFHHASSEGWMHDQTIQAMEHSLVETLQKTAKVTAKVTSDLLQSYTHSTPRTLQNHYNIQRNLQTNGAEWKSFASMTHVNGTAVHTPINQTTATHPLDMTRNVKNIEEFLQPPSKQDEQRTLLNQEQATSDAQEEEKPTSDHEPLNVVLFYADDWTMEVLGKLNPYVKTPNIDEMADDGMLFTRNCVTTSICWISRSTLATGVYSAVHKTNKLGGMEMFNISVPWLDTLFPLLKQKADYYTALIGKWHAASPRPFIQQAFDLFQSYYGTHWMDRKGQRRHITDLNGEDALAFLRSKPYAKKNQNFFLKISFFATHAWDGNYPPYQPMNESIQMLYNEPDLHIPMPETATPEHYQQLPWLLKSNRNEAMKRNKNRFDTPDQYQDKIRNLYRMATEVDAVIGAVKDELMEQGLYEKTLLIFTTDNGNLHGQHGLAEKWFPFEESLRVPLVIRDPRMPPELRGTRNDEFTLNVDLAPTILAAAGLSKPDFMQGRDIAQLYLNHEKTMSNWRQDFFYEWTTGEPYTSQGHIFERQWIPAVFALVRKDYKYFYWPEEHFEQLYHVAKDPFDEHDVINVTTTQQTLQLMRARYQFLKKWAQAGNPV